MKPANPSDFAYKAAKRGSRRVTPGAVKLLLTVRDSASSVSASANCKRSSAGVVVDEEDVTLANMTTKYANNKVIKSA